MKAFILNRYSKTELLQEAELANPKLLPDEVLVQVHATSVNPLDLKIRNGEFKQLMPVHFPVALGQDLAGVVVQLGEQVQHFKIGDEVYASPDSLQNGTFAEYVAVKENALAIRPNNISMEEAASIPLVGLTSWQILVERAKIKPGQKILIQAGSGGVGTFAIQLAKYLGAQVATTTSTANLDWIKNLGADVVIDYKQEDFENKLSEYDCVLNSQDNTTLKKSLKVLKPGGQLISISGPPDVGFAETLKLAWPFKQLMRLLSWSIRRKAKSRNVNYSFHFKQASGAQLQQITAIIEAGAILPVIDKVFPFEQTNQALAYVESGRAKGKVVIKVR